MKSADRRTALIVLIVAAVLTGFYLLVIGPAWSEWSRLGVERSKLNREISVRKAAANRPDQTELERSLRPQFGRLLESHSEVTHTAAKIQELGTICAVSGMEIGSYHPLATSLADDHWRRFPLKVVLTGSLAELTDTLFRISNQQRLLDVERLDIRRKAKGGALSCDLLLATYAYSSEPLRKTRRRATTRASLTEVSR